MSKSAINYLKSETLDDILEKMIDTVDKSKNDIFQIGEASRQDYKTIVDEIEKTKQMVLEIINEE